jgi:hypothetical protein
MSRIYSCLDRFYDLLYQGTVILEVGQRGVMCIKDTKEYTPPLSWLLFVKHNTILIDRDFRINSEYVLALIRN